MLLQAWRHLVALVRRNIRLLVPVGSLHARRPLRGDLRSLRQRCRRQRRRQWKLPHTAIALWRKPRGLLSDLHLREWWRPLLLRWSFLLNL